MAKQSKRAVFYGSAPPYPISRAVRAGDFVITCAMGDRAFAPEEAVYDERGRPASTGRRIKEVTFAEEVRGTFKALEAALKPAGCTLADVVDVQVWLRDPRDFHEMNRIFIEYFKDNRPVRSVFQNDFMFEFRIEMKVVCYKPL
jgi:enamine deaminase RidA (YjgF/YER057c/UK114 family)